MDTVRERRKLDPAPRKRLKNVFLFLVPTLCICLMVFMLINVRQKKTS